MQKPYFIREFQEIRFGGTPEKMAPNWEVSIDGTDRSYEAELVIPDNQKYIQNERRDYLSTDSNDEDLTKVLGNIGLAKSTSIKRTLRDFRGAEDFLVVEFSTSLEDPFDYLTFGDNSRMKVASYYLQAGYGFQFSNKLKDTPSEHRLSIAAPA